MIRLLLRTSPIVESENYLRHVDGLRAVAVLSVIFYHFGIPYMDGGFVGVDVFFVISGFLITRLICDEIQKTGQFSFKRFYARRVRRLAPALLVVLGFSAIFAIVLLTPEHLYHFGRSLAASALSVSNVLFWTEAGYFDADSHTKPLLHTWSLSIEEQFYLLWPGLIALLMVWLRLGQGALVVVVTVLFCGSLALNHLWVTGSFDENYRSTIFFLLPFRVYEFAIGAAGVFVLPFFRGRQHVQEVLMVSGLAMIGWSVITYNEDVVFPYLAGLIPCLGALFVIVSSEAKIAGRLISNNVSVAIGLISYSLYLWHWPFLVFYGFATGSTPSLVGVLILIAATFAAAFLTYIYVETPCRRAAPSQSARSVKFNTVSVSLLALGLVVVAGAGTSHALRLEYLPSGWALSAGDIKQGMARRLEIAGQSCKIAALDDTTKCDLARPNIVLLLGNSHEPDGYTALHKIYGQDPSVQLISFESMNGCKIQLKDRTARSDVGWGNCKERVARLMEPSFIKKLDIVVYASHQPFAGNKAKAWRVLQLMQQLNPNLKILVLGGFLQTRAPCSQLINEAGSFEACTQTENVTYKGLDEQNFARTKAHRNVAYSYIDTFRLLCPNERLDSCVTKINGEPVFYDKHHLSFSLSQRLGRLIATKYSDMLVSAGLPPPVVGRNEQ
ncbi:MAG: acyltransferase family protein [Filomicrobium sp.]